MSVAVVLVSHSKKLAEAARDLAQQMTGDKATIALAAGTGDDGEELGTDATRILDALMAVDRPDGTLVLMDLGSAILSAEMALDLAEPDLRERVRLVPAPFVEGAVTAAVAAASGLALEAVVQEALGALAPKLGHFDMQAPPAATGPQAQGDEVTATATIPDPHGLHARPAAALARTANDYVSTITIAVENGRGPANAKSLVALSSLGARQNDRLLVSAKGPDARAGVDALARLIETFTGAEGPAATPVVTDATRAVPVSPGLALGPVVEAESGLPDVSHALVGGAGEERAKLEAAFATVRAKLAAHGAGLSNDIAGVQAGLLDDPSFGRRIVESLAGVHAGAAQAALAVTQETIALYQALPDPVQAARATDIADLGRALLEAIVGARPWQPPTDHAYVLLADDLPPSVAIQLDPAFCLGVVDRRGGPTSHAAILLRSAGIPAIAGAGKFLDAQAPDTIAFDGGTGDIWPDPDASKQADVHTRLEAALRQRAVQPSVKPIALPDGTKVQLYANVAGIADAKAARAAGAGGVGLLRTEIMFLDRADAPSVDEQIGRLQPIFDVFEGCPVVVRTLDAGADKPVPFIPAQPETNPYLGLRGLRLSLAFPEIFEQQIEAILRAGIGHDVCIMLPMVTNADEVVAARAHVAAVHDRLAQTNVPHLWPVSIGTMIEVPGAALTAAELAQVCDFFSIGTNDLTQYTLAAERGHAKLERFSHADHPAVLALIRATVQGAAQRGISVSVCGEAAGEIAVAPKLVECGIRVLSMGAARLAPLAQALERWSLEATN
ncbi:dihydroxyacetone kinase phosphoryl donor subunit DhaM [Methylovirgula sp. 4M-Z18]|uniref:dihydroxyacetone kinase phosphoryl donor subunit DhaM n=1 Tax=Methylovirgula sp. 4M-Z18 TaxID=2293567 RepID=UPI000E2FBB7A|nr:dihydroxyacetone kinase phosphoryl donor subunit DhaM [Methylovirgula sp. 4M-Z18]RFB80502.1 HPr family phosphocarrier protein [Methylovirgula sp. 4M-Z18]